MTSRQTVGGLPSSIRPSARAPSRLPPAPASRSRSVGRPTQQYDNDDGDYRSTPRALPNPSSRPALPSNPRTNPSSERSRSVGRKISHADVDYEHPSRRPTKVPELPTNPRTTAPSRQRPTTPPTRSTPTPSSHTRERHSEDQPRPTNNRYDTGNDDRGGYDRNRSGSGSSSTRPRTSTPSMSSNSSAGSSLFERRNGRSVANSSARTSLDDEDARPFGKGRRGQDGGYQGRDPQGRDWDVPDEEFGDEEDGDGQPPAHVGAAAGFGASIWNRVAEAAGTLTVSVSKAWVAKADGEDTPEGKESRLTTAMKNYHVQNARTTADLPKWLFTDMERKGGGRQVEEVEDDLLDGYYSSPDPAPMPVSRRGGVRGVSESTVKPGPPPSTEPPGRSAIIEDRDVGGTTKAANRLKALREAKQSVFKNAEPVAAAPRSFESKRSYSREEERAEFDDRRAERRTRDDAEAVVPVKVPPRRIGLPSGPRRV